ncbi:MAG: CTP synthase, partial [Acidobacteria bacterium]|nr:CTP synthase [Acidobacteriota bacterium]
VTDDGSETDLDLGHYERFIDVRLTHSSNVTAGQIYSSVIARERRGDYLGGTIQAVPHVTNEIKDNIKKLAQETSAEVVVVEVGGTVGDIEGLPFLEAIRQMRNEVGRDNVFYIHVTFLPYISATRELKTKPTQHSVKELRSIGIQPDILLCRTERPLTHEVKAKIAMFCSVAEEAVITARDVDTIYQVPLALAEEKLDEQILRRLDLPVGPADLRPWHELLHRIRNPADTVRIGVVGKYVQLTDSYKSLNEALVHGGLAHNLRTEVAWIESEGVEGENWEAQLQDLDGILVPGGFGKRGIPGMLNAIRYARERKIPFFGICLGMQCAVIEFARNVCGLGDANSTEFNPGTPHRVIYKLRELLGVDELGGTMRLGAWPCKLEKDSWAHKAFGELEISERHRHRYEFNREYEETLVAHGLRLTGATPDGTYVEIVELADHPWFLGCQFHPEFKSKPFAPHPLFKAFIQAAYRNRTAARDQAESPRSEVAQKEA